MQTISDAEANLDRSYIRHTPTEYNESLSKRYGAEVYLKREDQQLVRSFKIRGAYTKIVSLSAEEKTRGVVAASAGNHAQGVALTCAKLWINGTIFMPQTTPSQKVRKTKSFGGSFIEIRLVGDTFNAAYDAAKTFCEETKAVFVHPFDDEQVMAGQGTLACEVIVDMESLAQKPIDVMVVAIGGGGLIAGVGTVFKDHNPNWKLIGVESAWSASMKASLNEWHPINISHVDTFCDGVAVKRPGDLTFGVAQRLVDDIVVVDDGHTATAMLQLLDDQGIITEPAGALSIAALDEIQDKIRWKTVVCIVCGGNFDFARLPAVEEKSLKRLGLKRYFIITFPQRPWALREFLQTLGPDDDIVRFEYMKKTAKEYGPALVGIQSSHPEQFEKLIARMTAEKIAFEDITHQEVFFDLLV